MSDLKAQFETAVDQVQNAPSDGSFKPSNDYKLRMYALYKQATDGDVHGKKPGMLDPVGRMKYAAWEGLRGTSADDAMQQYIDEVEKVAQEHK